MAPPVPINATSTLTANRGLFLMGQNNPDYEAKGYPTDLNSTLQSLDLPFGVVQAAVNGAIAVKEGTVFITKAGVCALTLPAPIPGLPSAGGDDGRVLTVKSTTGFAHTVTTPLNGINASKQLATFSGAVTDVLEVQAFNGSWWTLAQQGVTLT